MEKIIEWQLNINQANYILNILAQRPFAEVNELIQTLVVQINQRNGSIQPTPEVPEAPQVPEAVLQ